MSLTSHPVLDEQTRSRINQLRQKALAYPVETKFATKWMQRDFVGFGKWLFAEYGSLILPVYRCIFTVEPREDGARVEALSLSVPPLFEVSRENMEAIAKAFGLGDHTEWDHEMPTKFGQTSYSVMRVRPREDRASKDCPEPDPGLMLPLNESAGKTIQ